MERAKKFAGASIFFVRWNEQFPFFTCCIFAFSEKASTHNINIAFKMDIVLRDDFDHELAVSDGASSTEDEIQDEEEVESSGRRGVGINWSPLNCEVTGRPLVFDD